MSELPYTDCYAVVGAVDRDSTFIIELNIRNSEHHSAFRSDFELTARYHMSAGFDHAYGGDLEASAYTFKLTMLENAAKVLKKAYRKLEAMNKKFGRTKTATEGIIRQLLATGVTEVRIAMNDRTFQGWDRTEALSVKDDIAIIRERLSTLEKVGFEAHPFTGKIF